MDITQTILLRAVYTLLAIALLFSLTGCQTTQSGRDQSELISSAGVVRINEVKDQAVEGASRSTGVPLGVVAIGQISNEHPTSKLVYTEQSIRDVLLNEIYASRRFEVIDWSRMRDVLLRTNISMSDLDRQPTSREQVTGLLKNDYFLTGSVSSYGERMEFDSKRSSKDRTLTVQTQLDLMLKDSLSNEVLASARGVGSVSRKGGKVSAFGPGGWSSDPSLGTAALNAAARNAIQSMVSELDRSGRAPTHKPGYATTRQSNEIPKAVRDGIRLLIIVSERQYGKTLDRSEDSLLDISFMEQALAKRFFKAGYDVLTRDDIVGRIRYRRGFGITEREMVEYECLIQAAQGSANFAQCASRAHNIDIIFSGVVTSDLARISGSSDIEAPLATVSMSVKLKSAKRNKLLSLTTADGQFMAVLGPTKLKAERGALEQIAEKVFREVQLELVDPSVVRKYSR